MANWLEEMIQRVLGGQGEQYPGYTKSRMMTNQLPMGTPMQDPAQYGGPFRTPYGENMPIKARDLDGTFGAKFRTLSDSSWPGVPRNGTYDDAFAAIADSVNARVGWDDPGSFQMTGDMVDRNYTAFHGRPVARHLIGENPELVANWALRDAARTKAELALWALQNSGR